MDGRALADAREGERYEAPSHGKPEGCQEIGGAAKARAGGPRRRRGSAPGPLAGTYLCDEHDQTAGSCEQGESRRALCSRRRHRGCETGQRDQEDRRAQPSARRWSDHRNRLIPGLARRRTSVSIAKAASSGSPGS
ncbi:MAG: hypothetical protein ACRDZT_05220, partial [Acidimicrobiales bacterium]